MTLRTALRAALPRVPGALLRAAPRALALAAALAVPLPASAAGFVRDAEIEHVLHRLSDPIFRAAGIAPDSVNIMIIDQPDPNAFVFGGLNMVFSTGMLRKFSSPDELRGVMAHETGHIVGGHLARREIAMNNLQGPALAAMILGIAAAAAAGASGASSVAGAGAGLAVGGQGAVSRAFLAFSRSQEASADQAGLTFLERAGIDPTGTLSVLESFRGQEVFSDRYRDPYTLTHPVSAERLSALERRAKQSPYLGKGSDRDLIYWTDRMKAKLDAFIDTPGATLSRLSPDDRSELTTLRRAVALHRSGQSDKAVEEADRLLAIRPNDAYYEELKGQILLENGRGQAAVAPYRRAVALAPDEPLILGGLGRALLSVGTPGTDREALDALERGRRESDGGDPGLLRDLAFAYARTGQEGRAALVTAERLAMTGQGRDARRMAERAKGLLPHGGPEWLRADDIVASVEAAYK
ncbi:MAG: M48 family metalloprotease [Pseudomonadota bacterium]|nr:M48 family metalloprotease [Pseudomonadota bacterium]MEE3100120.1 M48 family metalloprotease [Pseudomonadota bacterium]